MKKLLPLILLSSSIALADDFPPIKEGLWETVMTDSSHSSVTKHCMGDQTTLKSMMEKSKNMMKGMCEESSMSKTAEGFVSKFRCNMGMAKLEVESIATGDFNAEYTISSNSKINPPMMGNAGSSSVSKAKYLGPCTGDMKPGDVIMADGKKMNINEMSQKMDQKMKQIDPKILEQMQKQMQQMMQNK